MDLRALTPTELKARVLALGAPGYRAEQVFRWLHGPGPGGQGAVRDLNAPANVPATLREGLLAEAQPRALQVDVVQEASDGTRKIRFRTHDGRSIESVLIPDDNTDRDKLTLCISSQVGCAMDCEFCATATLGFSRHLGAGEIVSQVYWATELAGRRLTNLVFMGMGEPLHNFDEMARALALLTNPWGQGLAARRITVSTSGLVTGIDKLGQLPQVPNLAISLNATTDELRDEIMPVNRKWPIADLLAACRRFPLGHNRKITFEYVLLGDLNDSEADAHRLRRLLRGIPSKINIIPWNPFAGPRFKRPPTDRTLAFQDILKAAGMQAYIRMPRGSDIDAACGQLAARDDRTAQVDVDLVRALRTPRNSPPLALLEEDERPRARQAR